MKKILVINGANMDLLGKRDTGALGADTLDSIMEDLVAYGKEHDVCITCFQSNIEGEIINLIHKEMFEQDAMIINPGSYGHYSIGIKEALDAVKVPVVEVHLANFFRKPENKSVLAPVCKGMVCGFGKESYKAAVAGLLMII